ncbi:MAG: polysaccharide deacetylase family protein [Magnetovibrionaceae bacterium]
MIQRSPKRLARLLVALALIVTLGLAAVWPPTGGIAFEGGFKSAAIMMYHRFGEGDHPATNIRLDQFDAHLKELERPIYTVLGLPEIAAKLAAGESLAERTVGLSADDAYRSVLTEAWPRLKARGLPFTLFVATDAVERGLGGYLTWAEIKQLADEGVTIGSQTHRHPHLPALNAEAIRAELETANTLFERHLGFRPTLLAYPYGESSRLVQEIAREMGFEAAFGQHSGAAAKAEGALGLFDLPRFPLNEAYGDMDRFRLAANAVALPITEVTPADPQVGEQNPPSIGFTLTHSLDLLEHLACYSSHAGRAAIERLGATRFEIRVEKPFPPGRTRVNCTLPRVDGRWHWFGRQYYRAPG